jgi:hypothetical protein
LLPLAVAAVVVVLAAIYFTVEFTAWARVVFGPWVPASWRALMH